MEKNMRLVLRNIDATLISRFTCPYANGPVALQKSSPQWNENCKWLTHMTIDLTDDEEFQHIIIMHSHKYSGVSI